ncbi:hypothetical protein [Crocosphaera sp. Alani8]|uniref:hypothetical protein n=1 Tax=Crocosphaera sp. Alani8 TaxID=3038952 RepID=UPI00313D235D
MARVEFLLKDKDQSDKIKATLQEAISRGEGAKKKLLAKEGGTLKESEVCEKLNCKSQDLDRMRDNGDIIAVEVDNQYLYPAWQFVDGKILPGLDKVLSQLKDDGVWTVIIFMLTGDVRLDGKTALEMLREGEIKRVNWAASCYGEHSAS